SAPDAKTSTVYPYTLTTTQPKTIKDARIHYALLKEQPHTTQDNTPHTPNTQERNGPFSQDPTVHRPPKGRKTSCQHTTNNPHPHTPPHHNEQEPHPPQPTPHNHPPTTKAATEHKPSAKAP